MELVWIVQCLVGIIIAVGAFLYRDLKSKTEKNQEDFLEYKVIVAQSYVSHPQLTQAIDNLNRNVEAVASGVTRIEARIYDQQRNNH